MLPTSRAFNSLRQAWHRTLSWGRDGSMLAWEVVQSKGAARDVIVAQAQQQRNRVATSLLSFDRHLGLLRYYGVVGYLQREQRHVFPTVTHRLLFGEEPRSSFRNEEKQPPPSSSSPNRNTNATSSSSSTRDQASVGRVAFMITAAQRVELSDRLGYEETQIKKMKPIEASLILQHEVVPSEMPDRLPSLVEAHHAALEQQQVAEEQERLEKLSATTTTTIHSRTWYEVVEIKVSDGTEVAVALYQTEEEAKVCMELKEDFAARDAREQKAASPAASYQVRRTVR